MQESHTKTKYTLFAETCLILYLMEICYFFRCIINMLFHNTSMILFNQIITNNFQNSIRHHKNIFRMYRKTRFNWIQPIGTRLQNTPQLAFLKIFPLLRSGNNFIFQGNRWIFIHCIDLIGIRTKIIELLGTYFY